MKFAKRLLAVVLTTALLALNLPGTAPAVQAAGEESDEFIPVRTIEDLYNIRDDLNANYRLMNDIDLTEATAKGGDWDFMGNGWNPIGSNDVYGDGTFTGIFDGGDHTIKGMRIEVAEWPAGTGDGVYLGLFARVSGEIRNLHMESGKIENVIGRETVYVGSIAGDSEAAIIGCSNTNSISSGSDSSYSSYCTHYSGGIVGNSSAEIRNCYNIGSVFAVSSSNSVYARNYSYSGGIAGSSSATISSCHNIGNVSAVSSAQIYSPYSYSGGIAGSNDGIIRNCYNIGSVSAASSASSSPYSYSGGIAGISNAAISNCYNTGSVSSSTTTSSDSYSYSGGIVGSSNTEIRNCYNRGDTTINKELGCGIAYLESEATIMDSYYLADTGRHTTGAVSLTNAQMQLSSTFRGFDFDGVWIQNKDYEYPYPQLRDNPQNMQEVVELIRLVSPPNKLAYFQGDELDTTGGMIEVLYVSGNAERFSITPDMVSGYDSSRLETQTLTVTYRGHTTTFDIIVSVRPKVVGMELLSGPDTTSFVKGTAFDFSGTQINVVYDNGGSAVLDVTDDMLSGADISQVGEQTVTVTFEGYTATFIITVLPVEMESLELTTLPKKTEYLEGEELDTTGLTLTARYNNGDERVITYGYTVTGYSPEPGTHTVTVEYSTKTATFEVKVKAKSVVSLEITQMPDKTEYFEGEEFDPTGLIVTATYDNGDKQAVTDYTYSGFDGKAGLKAIVVSYCGKTAAFSVKIQVRTVISLRIVQQPDKVLYLEGEDFDPTGLIVEATYSDGKTETVTDYELSGFSSTEGLKSIAVMYGGKIVSFTVTVMKTALEDLRITYPTKLTYYIGEAFDASGMVVTACYSNGKEIQVTDYTVEGFDSSTEGNKTLTVSYGGLTRAFVVTVIPRPIPEASFTVETVSGRPGEVVKVTVSVEKNPGLAGFRHTLTFDAAALRLEDVVMEGSFAEGTLVLNEEQTAQGQVTLVWFQTSDNLESGAVYTLTFTILEEAEGEYPITLTFDDWDNGNAAGENVLFQKQDGMVEALAYWLGDVTEDRQLTMKDVLLLAQVVSGQDIKLTENQQLAADVNENGAIDIHDVILLSQWLLDEPIGNEVMNI